MKWPSASSNEPAKPTFSSFTASSMSIRSLVADSTAAVSARRSYAAFTSPYAPDRPEAVRWSSPSVSVICCALQTNAEPSWNSGMLVIAPFSTASPYSAIEVSRRPFARSILNAGSALSSAPTTVMRAISITSFASLMAACAWARETLAVRSPSPSSIEFTRLSRAGSEAASCGFMESYNSAMGWVACIRASSALFSSRLSSSALKWPSASSNEPARSAGVCDHACPWTANTARMPIATSAVFMPPPRFNEHLRRCRFTCSRFKK